MATLFGCFPTQLLFKKKAAITSNESKRIPQTQSAPSFDAATPSTSLALRAQKKIIGKISTTHRSFIFKHFINAPTLRVFDQLFAILKQHYSKSVAEKTIKNMLKLSLKMAVCAQKDADFAQKIQLSRKKLRSLALTVMSFTKLDFSYDRKFLQKQMDETRQRLQQLVAQLLSEKSVQRVPQIFDTLQNAQLLDEMFTRRGKYHKETVEMMRDVETIFDGEQI